MKRSIDAKTLIALLVGMAVLLVVVAVSARSVVATPPEYTTSSPLLVNTRNALQLCIQVSPSLQSQKMVITHLIQEQMGILQQTHPDWARVYGGSVNVQDGISVPISTTVQDATSSQNATVLFQQNCPVSIPTERLDSSDMTAFGRGLVTEPSLFRAVVLVLDDATADLVIGDLDMSHAVYEVMKNSEHGFVEVTNAIVVRASAIKTAKFVDQYLSVAISLPPTRPFLMPNQQ